MNYKLEANSFKISDMDYLIGTLIFKSQLNENNNQMKLISKLKSMALFKLKIIEEVGNYIIIIKNL